LLINMLAPKVKVFLEGPQKGALRFFQKEARQPSNKGHSPGGPHL